jgi:HAMP domain-containing protein
VRLHPKRWSLATKWSLMLTALALGPLLAVIQFSYGAAGAQFLQQSALALSSTSADGAASLDDALGERVRQAEYLASLSSIRNYFAMAPGYRSMALADIESDLRQLKTTYPYLEAVDLVDAQGVVVWSTAGNRGLDRDPALLKSIGAGDVFVAGLRTETGKPGQSLVIAAPVAAGAGILRTQSSPEFLAQRVARDGGRQAAGAVGLLIDNDGHVIASDAAIKVPDVALDEEGKLTLAGAGTFFAQAALLQTVPWRYVVAMPEASLSSQVQKQRQQGLILALAVSLIIGSVARLLALGFTKPLTLMAEATRALAEGDLTHDMPPTKQTDEVGQLQSAFNEAYGQLRRLVARMRLSSILVAEAADHLQVMTAGGSQAGVPVAAASQKLSYVAKDLERQVAHFKV